MKKIIFKASLFIIFFWIALTYGSQAYKRHVLLKRDIVSRGDHSCLFDGEYIQGDVPIARLISQGEDILTFWKDFRNRFLSSEMAKPFHFGIIIIRRGGAGRVIAEAWGWSYWDNSFWLVPDDGPFNLAYRGSVIKDCQPTAL